jgi:hypothetical protein
MYSGTWQKSYVVPCLNLIFIFFVFGSYPMALMARELTVIISMSDSPLLLVYKMEVI